MVKKSLHKFRQDYNVWVGRIFLNQSLSKQNDHCPYLDLIKVIGSWFLKTRAMDDKTQPSQVNIKTNNNRKNEKDYNSDEKINVNQ